MGDGPAARAMIDACVLYPTALCDIVQRAGVAGLVVPLWSDRILDEWTRAAARDGGSAMAEAGAFAATFPEGRIAPPEGAEQGLFLPDPDDRHVLAAAIAGRADTILTYNLRDFPSRVLAEYGIAARHPDGFLWELQSRAPDAMGSILEAARAGAERASGQPLTLRRLLRRLRLFRLARALGEGPDHG